MSRRRQGHQQYSGGLAEWEALQTAQARLGHDLEIIRTLPPADPSPVVIEPTNFDVGRRVSGHTEDGISELLLGLGAVMLNRSPYLLKATLQPAPYLPIYPWGKRNPSEGAKQRPSRLDHRAMTQREAEALLDIFDPDERAARDVPLTLRHTYRQGTLTGDMLPQIGIEFDDSDFSLQARQAAERRCHGHIPEILSLSHFVPFGGTVVDPDVYDKMHGPISRELQQVIAATFPIRSTVKFGPLEVIERQAPVIVLMQDA